MGLIRYNHHKPKLNNKGKPGTRIMDIHKNKIFKRIIIGLFISSLMVTPMQVASAAPGKQSDSGNQGSDDKAPSNGYTNSSADFSSTSTLAKYSGGGSTVSDVRAKKQLAALKSLGYVGFEDLHERQHVTGNFNYEKSGGWDIQETSKEHYTGGYSISIISTGGYYNNGTSEPLLKSRVGTNEEDETAKEDIEDTEDIIGEETIDEGANNGNGIEPVTVFNKSKDKLPKDYYNTAEDKKSYGKFGIAPLYTFVDQGTDPILVTAATDGEGSSNNVYIGKISNEKLKKYVIDTSKDGDVYTVAKNLTPYYEANGATCNEDGDPINYSQIVKIVYNFLKATKGSTKLDNKGFNIDNLKMANRYEIDTETGEQIDNQDKLTKEQVAYNKDILMTILCVMKYRYGGYSKSQVKNGKKVLYEADTSAKNKIVKQIDKHIEWLKDRNSVGDETGAFTFLIEPLVETKCEKGITMKNKHISLMSKKEAEKEKGAVNIGLTAYSGTNNGKHPPDVGRIPIRVLSTVKDDGASVKKASDDGLKAILTSLIDKVNGKKNKLDYTQYLKSVNSALKNENYRVTSTKKMSDGELQKRANKAIKDLKLNDKAGVGSGSGKKVKIVKWDKNNVTKMKAVSNYTLNLDDAIRSVEEGDSYGKNSDIPNMHGITQETSGDTAMATMSKKGLISTKDTLTAIAMAASVMYTRSYIDDAKAEAPIKYYLMSPTVYTLLVGSKIGQEENGKELSNKLSKDRLDGKNIDIAGRLTFTGDEKNGGARGVTYCNIREWLNKEKKGETIRKRLIPGKTKKGKPKMTPDKEVKDAKKKNMSYGGVELGYNGVDLGSEEMLLNFFGEPDAKDYVKELKWGYLGTAFYRGGMYAEGGKLYRGDKAAYKTSKEETNWARTKQGFRVIPVDEGLVDPQLSNGKAIETISILDGSNSTANTVNETYNYGLEGNLKDISAGDKGKTFTAWIEVMRSLVETFSSEIDKANKADTEITAGLLDDIWINWIDTVVDESDGSFINKATKEMFMGYVLKEVLGIHEFEKLDLSKSKYLSTSELTADELKALGSSKLLTKEVLTEEEARIAAYKAALEEAKDTLVIKPKSAIKENSINIKAAKDSIEGKNLDKLQEANRQILGFDGDSVGGLAAIKHITEEVDDEVLEQEAGIPDNRVTKLSLVMSNILINSGFRGVGHGTNSFILILANTLGKMQSTNPLGFKLLSIDILRHLAVNKIYVNSFTSASGKYVLKISQGMEYVGNFDKDGTDLGITAMEGMTLKYTLTSKGVSIRTDLNNSVKRSGTDGPVDKATAYHSSSYITDSGEPESLAKGLKTILPAGYMIDGFDNENIKSVYQSVFYIPFCVAAWKAQANNDTDTFSTLSDSGNIVSNVIPVLSVDDSAKDISLMLHYEDGGHFKEECIWCDAENKFQKAWSDKGMDLSDIRVKNTITDETGLTMRGDAATGKDSAIVKDDTYNLSTFSAVLDSIYERNVSGLQAIIEASSNTMALVRFMKLANAVASQMEDGEAKSYIKDISYALYMMDFASIGSKDIAVGDIVSFAPSDESAKKKGSLDVTVVSDAEGVNKGTNYHSIGDGSTTDYKLTMQDIVGASYVGDTILKSKYKKRNIAGLDKDAVQPVVNTGVDVDDVQSFYDRFSLKNMTDATYNNYKAEVKDMEKDKSADHSKVAAIAIGRTYYSMNGTVERKDGVEVPNSIADEKEILSKVYADTLTKLGGAVDTKSGKDKDKVDYQITIPKFGVDALHEEIQAMLADYIADSEKFISIMSTISQQKGAKSLDEKSINTRLRQELLYRVATYLDIAKNTDASSKDNIWVELSGMNTYTEKGKVKPDHALSIVKTDFAGKENSNQAIYELYGNRDKLITLTNGKPVTRENIKECLKSKTGYRNVYSSIIDNFNKEAFQLILLDKDTRGLAYGSLDGRTVVINNENVLKTIIKISQLAFITKNVTAVDMSNVLGIKDNKVPYFIPGNTAKIPSTIITNNYNIEEKDLSKSLYDVAKTGITRSCVIKYEDGSTSVIKDEVTKKVRSLLDGRLLNTDLIIASCDSGSDILAVGAAEVLMSARSGDTLINIEGTLDDATDEEEKDDTDEDDTDGSGYASSDTAVSDLDSVDLNCYNVTIPKEEVEEASNISGNVELFTKVQGNVISDVQMYQKAIPVDLNIVVVQDNTKPKSGESKYTIITEKSMTVPELYSAVPGILTSEKVNPVYTVDSSTSYNVLYEGIMPSGMNVLEYVTNVLDAGAEDDKHPDETPQFELEISGTKYDDSEVDIYAKEQIASFESKGERREVGIEYEFNGDTIKNEYLFSLTPEDYKNYVDKGQKAALTIIVKENTFDEIDIVKTYETYDDWYLDRKIDDKTVKSDDTVIEGSEEDDEDDIDTEDGDGVYITGDEDETEVTPEPEEDKVAEPIKSKSYDFHPGDDSNLAKDLKINKVNEDGGTFDVETQTEDDMFELLKKCDGYELEKPSDDVYSYRIKGVKKDSWVLINDPTLWSSYKLVTGELGMSTYSGVTFKEVIDEIIFDKGGYGFATDSGTYKLDKATNCRYGQTLVVHYKEVWSKEELVEDNPEIQYTTITEKEISRPYEFETGIKETSAIVKFEPLDHLCLMGVLEADKHGEKRNETSIAAISSWREKANLGKLAGDTKLAVSNHLVCDYGLPSGEHKHNTTKTFARLRKASGQTYDKSVGHLHSDNGGPAEGNYLEQGCAWTTGGAPHEIDDDVPAGIGEYTTVDIDGETVEVYTGKCPLLEHQGDADRDTKENYFNTEIPESAYKDGKWKCLKIVHESTDSHGVKTGCPGYKHNHSESHCISTPVYNAEGKYLGTHWFCGKHNHQHSKDCWYCETEKNGSGKLKGMSEKESEVIGTDEAEPGNHGLTGIRSRGSYGGWIFAGETKYDTYGVTTRYKIITVNTAYGSYSYRIYASYTWHYSCKRPHHTNSCYKACKTTIGNGKTEYGTATTAEDNFVAKYDDAKGKMDKDLNSNLKTYGEIKYLSDSSSTDVDKKFGVRWAVPDRAHVVPIGAYLDSKYLSYRSPDYFELIHGDPIKDGEDLRYTTEYSPRYGFTIWRGGLSTYNGNKTENIQTKGDIPTIASYKYEYAKANGKQLTSIFHKGISCNAVGLFTSAKGGTGSSGNGEEWLDDFDNSNEMRKYIGNKRTDAPAGKAIHLPEAKTKLNGTAFRPNGNRVYKSNVKGNTTAEVIWKAEDGEYKVDEILITDDDETLNRKNAYTITNEFTYNRDKSSRLMLGYSLQYDAHSVDETIHKAILSQLWIETHSSVNTTFNKLNNYTNTIYNRSDNDFKANNSKQVVYVGVDTFTSEHEPEEFKTIDSQGINVSKLNSFKIGNLVFKNTGSNSSSTTSSYKAVYGTYNDNFNKELNVNKSNPSKGKISFYPYIEMVYAGTGDVTEARMAGYRDYEDDEAKDVQWNAHRIYALGEHERTMIANNLVEIGWVNTGEKDSSGELLQPSLDLTSTQWTTYVRAINNVKDSIAAVYGNSTSYNNTSGNPSYDDTKKRRATAKTILPGGAIFKVAVSKKEDKDGRVANRSDTNKTYVGVTFWDTVVLGGECGEDISKIVTSGSEYTKSNVDISRNMTIEKLIQSLEGYDIVQYVGHTEDTSTGNKFKVLTDDEMSNTLLNNSSALLRLDKATPNVNLRTILSNGCATQNNDRKYYLKAYTAKTPTSRVGWKELISTTKQNKGSGVRSDTADIDIMNIGDSYTKAKDTSGSIDNSNSYTKAQTIYTIASDVNGNVVLYKQNVRIGVKDGLPVYGTIEKAKEISRCTARYGYDELISNGDKCEKGSDGKFKSNSSEIQILEDRTHLISNYMTSIHRREGYDRRHGNNAEDYTWYNEAFDGISVVKTDLVFEMGFRGKKGANDVYANTFISAALDTHLTALSNGKEDKFTDFNSSIFKLSNTTNSASEFKDGDGVVKSISDSSKSYGEEYNKEISGYLTGWYGHDTYTCTDAISTQTDPILTISGISDMLKTKIFYIPNATVTDLNK